MHPTQPQPVLQTPTYPGPGRIGAATALATMGALPVGDVPQEAGSPYAYCLCSIGGAALGGGLVGYVAASDARGAFTGALLTSGLASLADAVALYKRPELQTFGLAVGLGGLFALGGSLFLAARRA